ncbi:MAG: TetR/AcrR family transcriptional regulator [Treponema sp.]|nr:TetR/AcrR family transcriptional regulator [Treponema sp.]
MEKNQPKETRKTRYTRMVLRESLIELMKTKPISAINIKEICALADISRSTFYAHYTDQYDLLKKIEEETFMFMDQILNKYAIYKNDKKMTLQMVEEILQYIADNNKSIYVLFTENGDIHFQKTLFAAMYQKNYLPLKSLTDKFHDESTKQYYFLFVVTGTAGLICHWISKGMDKSIHKLAKLIIGMTSVKAFS